MFVASHVFDRHQPVDGGDLQEVLDQIAAVVGGVPQKRVLSFTGDGATASFTVTHNLGTTDVIVAVWDSTGATPSVTVTVPTINTTQVVFGAAPANGAAFRVVIVG